MPDRGFQTLEFGRVVTEPGHPFRLFADEEHPATHQLVQFPENFQTHRPRPLSQRNHFIGHSAFRHSPSVPDGKKIQQGVRTAEIVGVTCRYFRMGPPVFGHDIGAFPVVNQDIRHVTALLEQVAAAGQVIRPVLRIIRPGLVPAEPLAEDQQAQAGLQLVRRLMRAFMDEKAVETAEQCQVGSDF